MHYYQFNIGDYASHTRHLTIIEDIAYRRLLDLYYLHEQPLNVSPTVVARLINMRGNEPEVAAVLSEFFTLIDGLGWINTRADAEIAKFHSKQEQASRAGKASAERRSNARSTDVQPTNNQEPITNISTTDVVDKARDKKPRFDPRAYLLEQRVDQQIIDDWLTLRKTKKAPATLVAIRGVQREAEKARIALSDALRICCEKGWAGFNADWDWMPKQAQNNRQPYLTEKQRRDDATTRAIFGSLLPATHDEKVIEHEPATSIRLG